MSIAQFIYVFIVQQDGVSNGMTVCFVVVVVFFSFVIKIQVLENVFRSQLNC